MNPFLLALIQAGIISRTDAERMNRSLDPDAARAWAEQQLAIAMQNGLSAQQTRLVDMVRRTNGSLSARQLDTFWAAEDDRLYASILGTLDSIATERAIGLVVSAGGDTSTWQHVNQAVLDWMHGYYTSPEPAFVGSVPNLNQTSRQQVADAFGRWARGELDNNRGLPTLIQELEPTFGPVRSTRIAVTEATRIGSESTIAAARADDTVTHLRYFTAEDEKVCPICSPISGQVIEKNSSGFVHPSMGNVGFPPLHVSCRCWCGSETEATMRIPVRP